MKEVDSVACLRVLIISLIVVCIGWSIQLAFHQLWLCIYSPTSWKMGFIFSILLSCLPLSYAGYLFWKSPHLPTIKLDFKDILFIISLVFIGVVFWRFFSLKAIYYPIHTYGDEAFHMSRVQLMNSDFYSWVHYFFSSHTPPPAYRAEYMMYPALAYVPGVLWNIMLGHVNSPADQRAFLVVSYLAVVITTYILSRFIVKSRLISGLFALLSISSALLLSYTMSFYIELHYVGVLLFSFWLLALGTEKNSPEVIFTAVFVSSLAPIIRESAIGGTIGIVIAAMLWHYLQGKSEKKIISRWLPCLLYLLVGLLPFSMYYTAKSNYSSWDKTRTSFSFLTQQDYYSLFTYAFMYLGPLLILSSFILCIYFKRATQHSSSVIDYFCLKKSSLINEGFHSEQLLSAKLEHTSKPAHLYILLAAVVGIILELAIQAIFLPGFMPWTRNYLFYYAQFMVLSILCVNYFLQKKESKIKIFLIPLLVCSVFINTFIGNTYLKSNKWFHESEVVFDLRPITAYINEHRQQFENRSIYIYWPEHFPTYPESLLPNFIKLIKIPALKAEPLFFSFERVQSALPKDARYILFYYLKNSAKPQAFHNIPAVKRPQLSHFPYHVLIESIDPWSSGNNGVMLLEKT
jgi:hypothetical protein